MPNTITIRRSGSVIEYTRESGSGTLRFHRSQTRLAKKVAAELAKGGARAHAKLDECIAMMQAGVWA